VVVGWAPVSELGSEPSPCVHGLSRTTAMPSLGWPVDLAMGPYYTPRISGVVVAERNNDPCDRRDRCLSRLGLSPPRAAQSTEEAVGTLDEC
jgi:hypothetical protein